MQHCSSYENLIPSIDEVKSLSSVKIGPIIKDIVATIKTRSIAGETTAYKYFYPSCGVTMDIANQIKQEFVKKGYGVTVFRDTSYRNDGISLTIVWS